MLIKKFHDCVTKEFAKVKLSASFDIVKDCKIKSSIVFVFTIFRMNKPYKDDSIYTEGLKKNIADIKKYVKNSIIRIYYDDSVLKKDDSWCTLFKKLCSDRYIQLIKYNFKQFKENAVFHKNLFGTLIRFLPLFDFYKTNETVIIQDIDYDARSQYNYTTYIPDKLKFINDKKNIIFVAYGIETFMDKSRLEISYITKKYNFLPRVVAQPIISSTQINKDVFIEFMKCMYVKCTDFTTWMNETVSRINCESNVLSEKDRNICEYIIAEKFSKTGLFLFGIDEFFINFYLFNELLKNKKNFYIFMKLPPMGNYNYFLYDFMYKRGAITRTYIEDFQKFVLEDNYTNNMKHNYNLIDSVLYVKDDMIDKTNSDKNKLNLYNLYSKRIYDFICNSLSDGSLKNNLTEKKNRFKNYYNKYFGIISQIKLRPFVINKELFKVSYEKNKVSYKPLK